MKPEIEVPTEPLLVTEKWFRIEVSRTGEEDNWFLGHRMKQMPVDPKFVPPCPEFEPIRELGRRHGYNIVEHGSQCRDYDLLAVPWVDDAVSPEALIAVLCDHFGCRQIGPVMQKPHGRIAVTLQRDKWEKHWDLSIIKEIQ